MRERTTPPCHPGEIIRHHHIEPLNLSIAELARVLGLSRKTVSKVVNGHGAVTPDIALRLSRAFNTTPELWLNLQRNYDLWHAAKKLEGLGNGEAFCRAGNQ